MQPTLLHFTWSRIYRRSLHLLTQCPFGSMPMTQASGSVQLSHTSDTSSHQTR